MVETEVNSASDSEDYQFSQAIDHIRFLQSLPIPVEEVADVEEKEKETEHVQREEGSEAVVGTTVVPPVNLFRRKVGRQKRRNVGLKDNINTTTVRRAVE